VLRPSMAPAGAQALASADPDTAWSAPVGIAPAQAVDVLSRPRPAYKMAARRCGNVSDPAFPLCPAVPHPCARPCPATDTRSHRCRRQMTTWTSRHCEPCFLVRTRLSVGPSILISHGCVRRFAQSRAKWWPRPTRVVRCPRGLRTYRRPDAPTLAHGGVPAHGSARASLAQLSTAADGHVDERVPKPACAPIRAATAQLHARDAFTATAAAARVVRAVAVARCLAL
jgi:hypothetical protein